MSRILAREGYKKFGLRRGLSERPTNLIKWRWQRAKLLGKGKTGETKDNWKRQNRGKQKIIAPF